MIAKGIDNLVLEKRQSISDADIVSYYLGINKIPTRICSPLRKDEKPSFGLYSRDGIHIYYTDFANGDKGSIIDLLQKMWGLDYNSTWEKIVRELTYNSSVKINKTLSSVKVNVLKDKAKLEVTTRNWNQNDFNYWQSYGISKEWLDFANVHPISHIIFIKDWDNTILKADKLAYVFPEFKEGTTTYKIYQPLNKNGYKWLNNHDGSVISLWTKVPEYGEKIVICSSLKDALCLWSNTGIPAISPQGESYSLSETAVRELKRRYKNIYILYDNDEAGKKDGEKIANQTGFKNIVLPNFVGGKDVSDLYKILNNPSQFREVIINLLTNN